MPKTKHAPPPPKNDSTRTMTMNLERHPEQLLINHMNTIETTIPVPTIAASDFQV
jgi:hypothetical protein